MGGGALSHERGTPVLPRLKSRGLILTADSNLFDVSVKNSWVESMEPTPLAMAPTPSTPECWRG